MADNGSAQSASTQAWPLPSFYFKVSISNVGDISCSEISGLEVEYDVIEYRAGDSKIFTKTKMPGLLKTNEITLKKGIFKDDKTMWDWINKIKLNTIQRESATVNLMDESGSVAKTWKIANVWPKKFTIEGFKAESNTPAFESLILVHEGVTVE